MATAQGTYKGQTIYAGDDAYISSQMRAIDSASTPTAPAPTMAPTTASSPSSFSLTPQAQQGLSYVQKSNPQLAQQIQGATTPQAQPVQQQTAQPSAQTTTQQVATTAQQPSNVPQANLQPGAQGQQVKELQSMLQTLGYLTPQQIATGPGIYGPATTAAVAKLQKDLGVQTGGNEGFYGPKTREALKNKYRDAFGQLSGTAVPDSSGAARGAIDSFLDGQPGNEDKQRAYFEELFNMNPVESAIFQQLGDLFNPQTQKQSLVEMMGQMTKEEGVLDLKLELADMKKIMDGTREDIATEITKAGGFATESQVAALTAARNKTLLKQASYLSDVIEAKENYIDKVISLTQADRDELDKQLERKLGMSKMMLDMTQSLQKNARENLQSIVKDMGYDSLVDSISSQKELETVAKTLGVTPQMLLYLGSQKTSAQRAQQLDELNFQLSVDKFNEDKRQFGLKYALDQQEANAKFAANTIISPYQAERTTRNIATIDSLLPKIGAATVGAGSYLSYVAGTTARDFDAEVAALKANIAFSELTAMREASKTGGALGAISDRELSLLQSSLGALDTGQSPAAFKKSLQTVKNNIYRWNAQVLSVGNGYDYDAAKKEGYTDEEIFNFLNK